MANSEPTYCAHCGKENPFVKYHPRKYCSPECVAAMRRAAWSGNTIRAGLKPANSFPTGHKPWNLEKKGIHLSPASEFKPGLTPHNKVALGTVSIITDKNGKERAVVKVAEPNVWKYRAVLVWEAAHGPLAKGLLVHHRDRNSLNDAIGNLQAMTRAEHLKEHRPEFEAKRRAALARKTA